MNRLVPALVLAALLVPALAPAADAVGQTYPQCFLAKDCPRTQIGTHRPIPQTHAVHRAGAVATTEVAR